jgi:hypothetical protein
MHLLLVAKQGGTWREMSVDFADEISYISRRKACCEFLSPLKLHRPRPCLNPGSLGPMASTVTVTLPRTTRNAVNFYSNVCFRLFDECNDKLIYRPMFISRI